MLALVALWAGREILGYLHNQSDSVQGTVIEWAKEMQKTLNANSIRIDKLESYVRRMERENQSLRAWAAALVFQVKEAGLVPVPFEDYDLYPEESSGSE